MRDRWVAALGAVTLTALLGAPVLEVAFRVIDHQPLTSLSLTTATANIPRDGQLGGDTPDLKHLAAIPLASGIDRDWYSKVPQIRPRIPLDTQLSSRAATYATERYMPYLELNSQYLRQEICGGHSDNLSGLKDYFFFEPTDGLYPVFRHLSHISPPSWFTTNNFGWRGPDIELNRPADVIRIAFVGASTTVDSYDLPFSHPELIEPWLNLWAKRRGLAVRFEVINAGRLGIDSRSIAAIVQRELLPVDPDLVVFYEGANQFRAERMLRSPDGRAFPKVSVTFDEYGWLRRRSALASRAISIRERLQSRNGAEPPKPVALVDWPSGVDESAPDPHDVRLPMDLPQVVRNLDDMRTAWHPSTLSWSCLRSPGWPMPG